MAWDHTTEGKALDTLIKDGWRDIVEDGYYVERIERVVEEKCREVDTVITPHNVDVYAGWESRNANASVAAVGVMFDHEIRDGTCYYVCDRPPRKALLIVDQNPSNSLEACVGHELAHFEDWLERQETCERDDTFYDRLEKFGAKPNWGW